MSDQPVLICALDGCMRVFEPKVHNQRFCSKECCRVHTNKKILEQYHEKKNRDLKNRICKSKGCNTVLSIYNNDIKCSIHQQREYIRRLQSWGWDISEADWG